MQLGAFGVASNAEAMWSRVRSRPEVAGRTKLLVPAGAVTKLQAGGYASEDAARSACTRLAAAGISLPCREELSAWKRPPRRESGRST